MHFSRPGARRFEPTGALTRHATFTQTPDGRMWITDGIHGLRPLPNYPAGESHSPWALKPSTPTDILSVANYAIDRRGVIWGTDCVEGGIFARPGRGRRAHREPATSSPSPRVATPLDGWRTLRTPIPVLAFTPRARGPLPARPLLGHGDLQDRRRRAHRRDGPPGRRAAAGIGRVARATSSSSSPVARPASPARPTPCASTGWATPSTAPRRRTTAEALPVCAPGGIRTHTGWCLRPLPLPLGYRGQRRTTVAEQSRSDRVAHCLSKKYSLSMWTPWAQVETWGRRTQESPWRTPGSPLSSAAGRWWSGSRSSCTSPT